LDGLLGASTDTRVYFGSPLRRVLKKFAGSRVRAADAPFKFCDDMPGRAVAIHKGGLGFATAAIFAGVPQVISYSHEENWFTANAIVRAGAGAAAEYRSVT